MFEEIARPVLFYRRFPIGQYRRKRRRLPFALMTKKVPYFFVVMQVERDSVFRSH